MPQGKTSHNTIVEAQVVLFALLIALFVAWVMGIAKLFKKGRRTLGYIALAGILIPLIGLVGYAGWWIKPIDEWDRPPPDRATPGSQGSIL